MKTDRKRMSYSKKKTVFGRMISLLSFVVVVFSMAVLIVSFPAMGKYRSFVVLSGSMEPSIGAGSLIIVKPEATYRDGDVVTRMTKEPGVTITHRIIGIVEVDGRTVYRTRGDANDDSDQELFSREAIIGRVWQVIPHVGYVVHFSKTPVGFLTVVIIPSLIILADEVLSLRRAFLRFRDRRKEKQPEGIQEDQEMTLVPEEAFTGISESTNRGPILSVPDNYCSQKEDFTRLRSRLEKRYMDIN